MIGPQVQFTVQVFAFARLTELLVEMEHNAQMSSVEMFSKYMSGSLDIHDDDNQQWLGYFLLWLGTDEVCKLTPSEDEE